MRGEALWGRIHVKTAISASTAGGERHTRATGNVEFKKLSYK